jgi:hypothetical protein
MTRVRHSEFRSLTVAIVPANDAASVIFTVNEHGNGNVHTSEPLRAGRTGAFVLAVGFGLTGRTLFVATHAVPFT